MPRALPGVVGVLLAIAVVIPTPPASGQILSRLRRQQTQKGTYEIDAILSDERQRLAEMKVELALLSDIATFPYDFAARAKGKALELRGNVPNEMVRQRAMDLARHSTFLRGIDALTIQPNLGVRSSLRPQSIVQQEGRELLQKEVGGAAKQIALEVRPNGVVVLTGRIDCVESKLEISKLFRQLPGCTAVVNELTIEPIMLDGQRMVRVTHNNMLLVPPSALGQGLETQPVPVPATVPGKQMNPPTPLRSSSLDAEEGELHLPAALAKRQTNNPTKPQAETVGDDWEAFAPSKLPVKWGRPADKWESQAKELEAANQSSRQQPQPLPKPAKLAWTPQAQPSQDEIPTPMRIVGRSGEPQKAQTASASKSSRASAVSHPNFAESREGSDQAMTWRRPGGSEESETQGSNTKKEELDDSTKPAPPSSAGAPMRSSRRWPPAYVAGSSPGQGKPGMIAFEEALPPPKPEPTVIAKSRSLEPAELQRQIKSLCGRQAREVVAAVQKDGVILVRVKVANRSIEDQLSRKILSLPEMTSPRVRLMMEIEP